MARKSHAKKADAPENDNASTEAEPKGRAARGGATARGVWSGSVSFGLLQIPVTLFPGEQRSEEIHFRLLDKHDMSPIRYERVNASTGKAVEWKDIVKGFELEPDSYVVMEPDELKKANVKATQTIDIQDFVPVDQIDPAFFETPYYVVPQRRATKAYVLLREALKKKGALAVATFVLRTREHLVALMPVGDLLMLEILRFGHELRSAEDVPLAPEHVKASDIGSRELAMAEQLVEGMLTDWDPSKYRDRYYADVMKLIQEKAKHGTVKEHNARVRGEVATDVVDLLDLLKKSVAQKGHAKPGPKKAAHHRAKKKREAA
jgi:DNA end-binding protein Ku